MHALTQMLLAVSASAVMAGDYNVAINGTASHAIPRTLYGVMLEDINHSLDGGLYAELIRNRAFQQKDISKQSDALEAYAAIGGAQLSVVDTEAVSASLPNSLRLTVPKGSSGSVGFGNEGYWGIKVDRSWTYNVSFYAKLASGSKFTGPITVSLTSSSGSVFGSASITGPLTCNWTQYSTMLQPSESAPDGYNNLTVTVNGTAAAGQTVYFTLISLFPPTFKNRPNGVRMDLAQAFLDNRPAFFRFGGNNFLGESVPGRWIWNETLGSLLNRPGRVGNWDYINTNGFGLMEIVQFTEDIGMELIASVWDGLSLNPTTAVANDGLDPYIQEAIGLLDFLTGDPSKSREAALRASLGHPDPVHIKYCEIGNQDFDNSTTYRDYRWPRFYNALSSAFPSITFIATSNVNNPTLSPRPPAWDVHVYDTSSWFAQNAFYYDSVVRDGTVYLELEYAATSTTICPFGTASCKQLPWSTLAAAVSVAAFATGFERNADIVKGSAYVPALQNFQSSEASLGTPDQIGFNATNILLSAPYWAQQLLSLNKGTEYLPSTLPTEGSDVQWSVTRDASNTILIKVANAAYSDAAFTFTLPSAVGTAGSVTVLTSSAGPEGTNTIDHPNEVGLVTSSLTTGHTFDYKAPAWTFSVIKVPAA